MGATDGAVTSTSGASRSKGGAYSVQEWPTRGRRTGRQGGTSDRPRSVPQTLWSNGRAFWVDGASWAGGLPALQGEVGKWHWFAALATKLLNGGRTFPSIGRGGWLES